jgi:uncharacterized protein YqfA (UPF0365 family)
MNIDSNQLTVLIILLIVLIYLYYITIGKFWLQALLSGVRVTNYEILSMIVRKTPVKILIRELIKSHKAGILIRTIDLEVIHLAGGNIVNIVDGLIFAKNKGIKMDFDEAVSLDMQKKDLIQYLRTKA